MAKINYVFCEAPGWANPKELKIHRQAATQGGRHTWLGHSGDRNAV